jgi:hypothetical protein
MQRGESIGWESKEFENERKRITENVDFKSDTQLYRDTMNSLQQVGIKIGQIEFPKTEMVALTEAMIKLEEAYRVRIAEPPPDIRDSLPVSLPERDDDSLAGIRAQIWDGRVIQALLTAPPTNEGRYNALAGVITSGLTDSNAGGIQEYWAHRTALASAMGEGPEGKNVLTSNELRELIPVLRNLADAIGKSDKFAGKSNEEIHLWLTDG